MVYFTVALLLAVTKYTHAQSTFHFNTTIYGPEFVVFDDVTGHVSSGCGSDNKLCSCIGDEKGHNISMATQGSPNGNAGIDYTCTFNVKSADTDELLCPCSYRVIIPYGNDNTIKKNCSCLKGWRYLPITGKYIDWTEDVLTYASPTPKNNGTA